MTEPLFQPEGYGRDTFCRIADREKVYAALGLYSDYLNWNTESEIEYRLRGVLCEIYGHQPYSEMSWKADTKSCYWCFAEIGLPVNGCTAK